jgi:magnesium chelatase family protein
MKSSQPCMSDCRGRGLRAAVRAAERAVTERSNLLLIGPPGIGTTMLARRIPGIMPRLTAEQGAELTGIYQKAGILPRTGRIDFNECREWGDAPPFRAPHHTVSATALAREAILASHGVLLLDELPEFRAAGLRALAEQLASMGAAAPLVVASACPCPCGWHGSKGRWQRECRCPEGAIRRYKARLAKCRRALGFGVTCRRQSVSLADLRCKPYPGETSSPPPGESSEAIRARVVAALEARGECHV